MKRFPSLSLSTPGSTGRARSPLIGSFGEGQAFFTLRLLYSFWVPGGVVGPASSHLSQAGTIIILIIIIVVVDFSVCVDRRVECNWVRF